MIWKNQDLLISKLHTYSLSFPALKLMQDYLQNRKQRTRAAHNNWQKIQAVVPQGSIFGWILFTISSCDLFLEQGNIHFTNYADDTDPYVVGNNTTYVQSNLTKITEELFPWNTYNQMRASPTCPTWKRQIIMIIVIISRWYCYLFWRKIKSRG